MEHPDSQPYGIELAQRVAEFLEQGGQIGERYPRGYCLLRQAGGFWVVEIFEGEIVAREAAFRRRTDFEAWLAAQSDATLARFDTPEANRAWSLSRARIEAALAQQKRDEFGH